MPDNPGAEPVIFVSHAHADWELEVAPVCKRLELAGLELWTSHEDILNRWGEEITAILADESRDVTVLLFCSPNAAASDNVRKEFIYAGNHKRKIVPVLLKAFELPNDWQFHLAPEHWIKGYELNANVLVEELIRRLPPPKAPPIAPSGTGACVRLEFTAARKVVIDGGPEQEVELSTLDRETVAFLADAMRRRAGERERERVARLIGMQLFALAFGGASRAEIAERLRHGGRIELSFAPDARMLESWPWELLYAWDDATDMAGGFVVQLADVLVTRAVTGAVPPAALDDSAPLRLLTVAPRPDKELPGLDALYELLGVGGAGPSPWPDASMLTLTEHNTEAADLAVTEQRVGWKDFTTAVATFRPHVVHLATAVRLNDRTPEVAFGDPTGERDAFWVSTEVVARALVQARAPDGPSVVVLSTFAAGDDGSVTAGLRAGKDLARRDIPAVVVHPYEPEDEGARFVRYLYGALLDGGAAMLDAAGVEKVLHDARSRARVDTAGVLFGCGEPHVFLNPAWVRAATGKEPASEPPRQADGGTGHRPPAIAKDPSAPSNVDDGGAAP